MTTNQPVPICLNESKVEKLLRSVEILFHTFMTWVLEYQARTLLYVQFVGK